MPRTTRSETCFFRYEGVERKDIHFRIEPQAVRFQQGQKGSVTETLGGYFVERMKARDEQYSGLLLPELTIEGTTGIAYKHELKTLDWIWRHSSDRKKDGSPVDVYFLNFSTIGDYQGIKRDVQQAWIINIQRFAWDSTVQDFSEIKFSLSCKILRDLFWGLENEPPTNAKSLPSLDNPLDRPLGDFSVPVSPANIFGTTPLTL